MRWLLAAFASCLCFAVAVSATFVPLRSPTGLEYVFVWPAASLLLTSIIAFAAGLAILTTIVLLLARRHSADAFSRARSGVWLAPIASLGVVCLGVIPAIPGVGERGAAAGYFFYDLRWWWFTAAVSMTGWRIDRVLGNRVWHVLGAIGRWSTPARVLLLDGVLLFGVMGWAWCTSPNLRFDQTISGDEPRYIRYLEVWYQGQGFVVSTKQLMADQPLDASPAVLRNFALIPGAVAEETRALAGDLRHAAAHPLTYQWNRSERRGAYVIGKRGGTYEIYQPGVSFLLFPGYFLDRYLLGLTPGYQSEFPSDLMMTRLMALLIYGACAVALFRLLRHALGSDVLAWFWAALGMMMLPMTGFSMQFYPELGASLFVLIASNYVLFHSSRWSPRVTAAAGAAAAFLLWFHPRFVVVSVCLAVTALMKSKGRSRWFFIAGYALMALTVGAFDYRITGSWLPDALWNAPGAEETFGAASVSINLLAYALHPTWGLTAHAFVLAAVVPGLLVLSRRSIGDAVFIAAMGLALGMPAAAHTLHAAGTTVGRLVVAVVPLLIWPVAVVVRRFWSSAAIRAGTVIAVVLTLDAALAYNQHYERGIGPLHGPTRSGWRLNLAFPFLRDGGLESRPGNVALLVTMLVLIVGFSIVAFLRSGRPAARAPRSRPLWLVGAIAGGVFVLLSTAATAANAQWTRRDYLMEDGRARREATTALLALDRCRVCFTSRKSQIDWTWLQPNPIRSLAVHLDFVGRSVIAHIDVEPPGLPRGFGRMKIDFGDGSSEPWSAVIDRRDVSHAYAKAGSYRMDVWLQLPNGERRMSAYNVVLD